MRKWDILINLSIVSLHGVFSVAVWLYRYGIHMRKCDQFHNWASVSQCDYTGTGTVFMCENVTNFINELHCQMWLWNLFLTTVSVKIYAWEPSQTFDPSTQSSKVVSSWLAAPLFRSTMLFSILCAEIYFHRREVVYKQEIDFWNVQLFRPSAAPALPFCLHRSEGLCPQQVTSSDLFNTRLLDLLIAILCVRNEDWWVFYFRFFVNTVRGCVIYWYYFLVEYEAVWFSYLYVEHEAEAAWFIDCSWMWMWIMNMKMRGFYFGFCCEYKAAWFIYLSFLWI